LACLVCPIGEPRRQAFDERPLVMLLFRVPEAEIRGSAGTLARLYALSPRQAQLAEMLVAGHSLPYIAERLAINQETAKTHLRRIFHKTDTRSQSELVRLVASGPFAALAPGRWILAKLRHRRFFTLAELNHAIAGLVDELNRKPSRHLGASRRQLFEQIDRPALKPLPAEPYQYAEWKECRVGIDYHVEIDKHYYSVPHSLIRQPITARITTATIELLHRGRRVAAHLRSYTPRRHTTVAEHMPSSHRRYAGWTHERLRRAAADIGPETARLVDIILERKPHPEQGFRACLGIVRLLKPYGRARLEAACARALRINGLSYSSVASILKNNLDRHRPATAADGPMIEHANIRGPDYFH
jgi:transposase/DNA-binding CsgD family transcriptional regulator